MPSGDPIRGVGFQQWPGIKIQYNEMQAFEVIEKDIDRIQDLCDAVHRCANVTG
jgi:hypothetical protein